MSSSNSGQATRRTIVAQVHGGDDPKQWQIQKGEAKKTLQTKMVPARDARPAKVEQDLEPDAVASTLEIVKVDAQYQEMRITDG